MFSLRRATSAAVLAAAVAAASCAHQTRHTGSGAAAANRSLQDRIAVAIRTASPPADPADAAARDAAAERLVQVSVLLDAAGDRLLWGGFEPAKGLDPERYRLTEFSPQVWAKLYLSTFTFPGAYSVRKEGKYTVLEMAAEFRDGLDPGDYPYPFWHTAQKWREYVETHALLFVFEADRIVATFRSAQPTAGPPVASKPWNGRWHWTDSGGHEQPRVTLYSYMLSSDNPSRATLDRAYRNLEAAFRGQNCMGCHAPDNIAKANPLTLLNYPNQALVARHTLVEVLRRNRMPPANLEAGTEAGITDEVARQALLRLAEEFEREADAALAYERARASH
jgi:hypothetical protein